MLQNVTVEVLVGLRVSLVQLKEFCEGGLLLAAFACIQGCLLHFPRFNGAMGPERLGKIADSVHC